MPELSSAEKPKPVVRVRELSSTEVDRFLTSLWIEGADGKLRYNRQDYASKLVALSAINPEGERLFKDGDVTAIGLQSSEVVQRLAIVAERLSGLQAKQVESAAGN